MRNNDYNEGRAGGPMTTPFVNDPSAIVAMAFAELYPGVEYIAQLVPTLEDDEGGRALGETFFPEDGSTPVISISAEAPANAVPELLAHELAHLVVGTEAGHGPDWDAVMDAIAARYDELVSSLSPDGSDDFWDVRPLEKTETEEPEGER